MHYRYKLLPGATIPEHNPLNPKCRLMTETGKRLRLPVANLAETPDVHVTGRVPETRPYRAFADVAVTPPRIARKACRRAASSGQEP